MPKISSFYLAANSRRALTLIEMLVGMAITLVMMAAVVNLFANISTGVSNRQGAMEISADLRIARARLYSDLAGATVRTDDVGEPNGYFEIVEGKASDENPLNGSLINNPPNNVDPAISLIPSSNTVSDAEGNLVDPSLVTDFRSLGDFDDILAMTVESRGTPFRGRGRTLIPGSDPTQPANWIGTTIESQFAEVIWFAVENPADGSRGEPGMRTIYRRVLLIAPWVTSQDTTAGPVDDPIFDLNNLIFNPTSGNTFASRLQAMRDFQNDYDISVRFENQQMVPNTLADLSRREHRFAHMTNPSNYPQNAAGHYPYPFPYNLVDLQGIPSFTYYEPAGRVDAGGDPVSSLQPLSGERAGGDIVLTNALAFDVQVFDPGAPLYNYQGTLIRPNAGQAFKSAVALGASAITGFGAYTDLGWNNGPSNVPDYLAPVGAPATLFQQEHQVGWHPGSAPGNYRGTPSTYDSWTNYYETDQVDQDARDGNTNILDGADEGTNGLDDEAYYDDDNDQTTPPIFVARNGPDDTNERETSPPYPSPLKGVQVKLRVYEPNSRAIREANVTRSMAD
ncbi:PilW family protein [Bythopirellula polymerisocia]|uniref:Uncharacterized protein n=1 Tax=Bythopirellula polymerisocia TaxID=2528003 RepID=A0A5C6C893_9BACT|nr:prepilin-type N-terminal cleavage/methylation domain-containing protein [Bythopirellula polymerisocia]TWU20388.1 hypothetical protein Pla144_49630 [Bythopirellula polymerisocia]